MWFSDRMMRPNDAERMALFAQTYLSENLGSLR